MDENQAIRDFIQTLIEAKMLPDNHQMEDRFSISDHLSVTTHLIDEALQGNEPVFLRFYNDGDYRIDLPEIGEGTSIIDSGSNIDYIDLSLVTDKILQYDQAAFQALSAITDTKNTETVEARMSAAAETLGTFGYRPYRIEFRLDTEGLDGKPSVLEQIHAEEWFEGFLNNPPAQNVDDYVEVSGTFFFENDSHLNLGIEQRTTMYVSKKTSKGFSREDAAEIYKITNANRDPQAEFDAVLKDFFPSEVVVYSASTANCIALNGACNNGRSSHTLMFDVGYRYGKRSLRFSRFAIEAAELNPDLVILSHWDYDHVNGWEHIGPIVRSPGNNDCKKLETIPWIAPDYTAKNSKLPCISVQRLAKTLDEIKLLCWANNPGAKIITSASSNQDQFTVWQGELQTIDRIQPNNMTGFIIQISQQAGTSAIADFDCILAGDAPYRSFPPSLQNALNRTRFLVGPHHGSAMDTSLICSPSSKGMRCAIWCTRLNYWNEIFDLENSTKEFIQNWSVKTNGDHLREMVKCRYCNFPTGETQFAYRIDLPNSQLFIDDNSLTPPAKSSGHSRGPFYFRG